MSYQSEAKLSDENESPDNSVYLETTSFSSFDLLQICVGSNHTVSEQFVLSQ